MDMLKWIKRSSRKAGLPPGTLVHIGEETAVKTRVTVIDYEPSRYEEREITEVADLTPFKERASVTWINVEGIRQVDLIQQIGARFNIHPLTLEDIVHSGQRPKVEDFDAYLFVVLKMLYHNAQTHELRSEQVSCVLSESCLITFQETRDDVFQTVRERIRKGKGRIRKSGCDYLLYALMDAIVDHYFLVVENLGEHIESLEEDLSTDPAKHTLEAIHDLKREIIFFRKQIIPLRDMLKVLTKKDLTLISETTQLFLRDVHDHTIQVADTVDSYRDVLSGMLEVYLSLVSYRMNEVMKVLTIMATIFIPLTFVAGIYGMNFKHMPELDWRWGYFVALAAMGGLAGLMLIYFKRKKWL